MLVSAGGENLYHRRFVLWFGGGNRIASNQHIVCRANGDKNFTYDLFLRWFCVQIDLFL